MRPGEGVLKEPFAVEDGFLKLPTGPGLGVELDDDYLDDALRNGDEDNGANPESYSGDDGAVVDW